MLHIFPKRKDHRFLDPDREFWEVVGLLVAGMKHVLLGAIKFQRQAEGKMARQALTRFLSTPHSGLGLRTTVYPGHLLQVAVRSEEQPLTEFVKALNSGAEPSLVLIDRDLVRLCFDFRLTNPSIERRRFEVIVPERMSFRSSEGHVITGLLHSGIRRLYHDDAFLGVTSAVQHTPFGELPMPDLIVHRGFFVLTAECAAEGLPAQVFDPATEAVQPIIGLSAWRYFMARRKKYEAEEGVEASVPLVASAS